MLQRSQTLFLLFALVLSLLMFTGSFARFTAGGEEWILKHTGLYHDAGERSELATWPVTVIYGMVSLLTLFATFSYMNRVRQMRLTVFLIFLNAGMIGIMLFYAWFSGKRIDATVTLYQWRLVLPLVCMVLLYLAFRGIRRDELLVKAYDRLR